MIEFYDGDTMVAYVKSSMVPPVGAKINIRKQTWEVVRVTYALLITPTTRKARACEKNVDLKHAINVPVGRPQRALRCWQLSNCDPPLRVASTNGLNRCGRSAMTMVYPEPREIAALLARMD